MLFAFSDRRFELILKFLVIILSQFLILETSNYFLNFFKSITNLFFLIFINFVLLEHIRAFDQFHADRVLPSQMSLLWNVIIHYVFRQFSVGLHCAIDCVLIRRIINLVAEHFFDVSNEILEIRLFRVENQVDVFLVGFIGQFLQPVIKSQQVLFFSVW